MLKNFLITAFRNYNKNKLFAIANVLGLGVALACCIVAYFNNKFHHDFNDFHQNKEIIYKVGLTKEVNQRQQQYGFTPLSLKPALGNAISGVEEITRYTAQGKPVRYGEHIFNKGVAFVDSNYLEVFDLPMIEGDPYSFKGKNNILISRQFAGICFGDESPIGEMIKIYYGESDERLFRVSGIFEDIPQNASMQFELLCLMDNQIDFNNIEEHDWRAWVAGTFLLIPDKSNLESIQDQLNEYVIMQNEMRDDWPISSFFIEPLKDIPTTGRDIWSNWLYLGLHPAALIAPAVMAILLLLLACLNFTNTALAISSKRLKEIGLRKVFGGVRRQTMLQFLGENLILCLIALLFALLFGTFLIDAYSDMWPYMTLKINWTGDPFFWLFVVGLLIITGILAGSYPAFYVSRFNPITILQGKVKFSGGGLFSKILLTFQFLLAISGIISAVIFTQNAYFQDNLYLGYEKDRVIAVPVENNAKLEAFMNAVAYNSMIESIGKSEEHIGWGNYSRALKWGGEQEIETRIFDVGQGYFETMGLKLLAGRHFDQEFKESERGNAVIINEKLLEELDFDQEFALGQTLRESDTIPLKVVGVMENFYPYGFWSKIEPTLLKLGVKERMRMLVVQANEENLPTVNDFLLAEWENVIPNAVYPGFFQKDILAEAKDINRQIMNIFLFLAIVSVILSLIGLYTLVSLNIIRRTREIGIRKVLGASVFSLVKAINRDFVIILLIASALGSALGYYLSEMLLASIWTIYMDTSVFSFIIPLVFIFLVSILTLSGKVYKAATRNPVDSIKYE